MLVGLPTAAFADSAAVSGHTYYSSQDCPFIWTQISNNARPRMDTYGSIDWYLYQYAPPNANCADHGFQALPGHLAIQQQLVYWNGSSWQYCITNAPWVYNAVKSHDVRTGFGWGYPPCGSTYYYDYAASYYLNGNWDGSWTYTRYIWVG